MKLSYNWLQSFFKKKLPQPVKLADLLTMHSYETELIGRVGNDYLLEVDILPNRAHDSASHLGVAQEISAVLNYPLTLVDYAKKIKEDKNHRAEDLVKIEINDKNACPRYTARVVLDVKVAPSPKWLVERLKICGLRPINNIVDIANYAMLETGQPLHAFDMDKLFGEKQKKILVRWAKKGEKIVSLDDEKYDLDNNILVIADSRKPVAVAGIKGGKEPEIDKKTKRVVLESANFSPQVIRQGSSKLKLETDASWRFERQIDLSLTEGTVNMAAWLIEDIAKGKTAEGLVDINYKKTRNNKISLDIKKMNSLLGVDVSIKEAVNILKRLGFFARATNSKIEAIVPLKRLDILSQEDLIEEIGRLYGLEKIPSRLPEAVLIPPQRNEDLVYQNKVKDILANLGFSEVYNYSFVSEKDVDLYKKEKELVEVANSVSAEQKYLRPDLTLNLIKNINRNKKYFKDIKLFEVGRVFNQGSKKTEIKETKKIASIIALEKNSQKGEAEEFFILKGIVDSVLNSLRLSNVWYDEAIGINGPPSYIHQARRAEIKVGNDYLGWIGEINKEFLDKMDIGLKAAAFELNFAKLVEMATEERIYLPPSKYPSIVRDIALLVESGTKIVEVLNLIHAAGGKLIKDIDLFDIYEGENIPGGKKNLAFHIVFQSDERTLTDKEVNSLMGKIIKTLEEEGGWQIRK